MDKGREHLMLRSYKRIQSTRRLSYLETFLVALTSALAVATVALAIASSARASSPAGHLPQESPFRQAPVVVISHAEVAPEPGPSDAADAHGR
jgi:hypothetical protein